MPATIQSTFHKLSHLISNSDGNVLLSVYTQEDGDMKTLSNVLDHRDNKQQKWI